MKHCTEKLIIILFSTSHYMVFVCVQGAKYNPFLLDKMFQIFLMFRSISRMQAVSGDFLSQTFSPETGNFLLSFVARTELTHTPSLIYLNEEIHYPNGFTVRWLIETCVATCTCTSPDIWCMHAVCLHVELLCTAPATIQWSSVWVRQWWMDRYVVVISSRHSLHRDPPPLCRC